MPKDTLDGKGKVQQARLTFNGIRSDGRHLFDAPCGSRGENNEPAAVHVFCTMLPVGRCIAVK